MAREDWIAVKVRKETWELLKENKKNTGASYAFTIDKAVQEFIERRKIKEER